jgi:hypothetical protein
MDWIANGPGVTLRADRGVCTDPRVGLSSRNSRAFTPSPIKLPLKPVDRSRAKRFARPIQPLGGELSAGPTISLQ